MTNGRGASMASFMTKKKKYKFQVDICLEELLEVPFVSAVLFAKLRLLDGGNFQDFSSRQEVRDHKVHWDANFAFPCKMSANASTGVMERCILRISIRKESRGGKSNDKLGFVDLNLAEYAGAGLIHKKALLEGYNTRHRQDNSMIKFKIQLNMISGDILFKVPTPSLKHQEMTEDVTSGDHQRSDEFSSGSLAGSIASGSSGFGSLPKKRTPLLASDLVISQTLTEGSNLPVTVPTDLIIPPSNTDVVLPIGASANHALPEHQGTPTTTHNEAPPAGGPGHSRNSSNTSQLSKASGYSSIHSHSHSRQSSSGDSGHIRHLRPGSLRHPLVSTSQPKNSFARTNTYPNKHRVNIPNTIVSSPITEDNTSSFLGQNNNIVGHNNNILGQNNIRGQNNNILGQNNNILGQNNNSNNDVSDVFSTPKGRVFYSAQTSNSSGEYHTPDCSFITNENIDVFSKNFNALQKSASSSVVETVRRGNMVTIDEHGGSSKNSALFVQDFGVLRSKSEFEIPRIHENNEKKSVTNRFFKSDSLLSFFTPKLSRKISTASQKPTTSTPNNNNNNNDDTNVDFKVPFAPTSPICMSECGRATSLSNLRLENEERHLLGIPQIKSGLPHRKLLDTAPPTCGGKLAPLIISPDESPMENHVVTSENTQQNSHPRRPSTNLNPSAGSLVVSETGSLDRAKAAYERRKKINQSTDSEGVGTAPGRVEITRVDPDGLIEELLKNTNLEQHDDSAETSGLQLFIAKDGTAAVGNREVKSQMSTGVQSFKQVVMGNNR